jgi:hypothetical protein
MTREPASSRVAPMGLMGRRIPLLCATLTLLWLAVASLASSCAPGQLATPTAAPVAAPTGTPVLTPASTPTAAPANPPAETPTKTPSKPATPTVGTASKPTGPLSPAPTDWGPAFNTAGASLDLVEAERRTSAGGSTVLYIVKATGLPQGVVFDVWSRPLSKQPQLVPWKASTDPKGRVVDADDPSEELPAGIQNFAKGEPFEMALISQDGKTRVFGRVVPFPLEATGAGGCRLAVELARNDGQMFIISGSGFVPGEQVTWTSVSAGERIANVATVKSDGALDRVFFLPAVIGQSSGVARYSVQGSRCSVAVEYEWGPPALKPQ